MFPGIPGEDYIFSFYTIFFALALGMFLGFRNYMRGPPCPSKAVLKGKTVIVTGANSGVGLEVARELASRGARVVLACRDEEKGKAAVAEVKRTTERKAVFCMKLDLASFQSIREFVETFNSKEKRLDILVNNAGIMCHPLEKTEDGYDINFQTNYLGPSYLTMLLLGRLKACAPSRIVNTSALAYQLGELDLDDLNLEKKEDVKPGDFYGASKLAVMLFSRQLSRYLEGSNVTVSTVHPGVVYTNAHRHMPFRKSRAIYWSLLPLIWLLMKGPKDGAQTTVYCAVAKEEEGVSGKFYGDCRMREPDENAKDDEAAKKLWEVTLKLTGIPLPIDTQQGASETETETIQAPEEEEKSSDPQEAKNR